MSDFDHEDAEALPVRSACTEREKCDRMTVDEQARRCACRALEGRRRKWDLTPADRQLLRELKISGGDQ